jgi:flagellin-like protein
MKGKTNYKNRKKLNEDTEGVSPVIGVMLMIVVTVILAPAVSAYSSGMVSTTSVPPIIFIGRRYHS